MVQTYITVCGGRRLVVGDIICCKKERTAKQHIIKCTDINNDFAGYVANLPTDVVDGTNSANKIYLLTPKTFYARVYFAFGDKAVCRVIAKTENISEAIRQIKEDCTA